MKTPLRRPTGYLTKTEVANQLGISEKTLDRRIKAGDLRARLLKAGGRLWLFADDVEAYFRLSKQRGYI